MKIYSKDTPMWQAYEELFLNTTAPDIFNEVSQHFEPAPIQIPCQTKGEALNLAMGLNACQIQDFMEKGTPKSFITKSAKAKILPNGEPVLEISVSYRHRPKPRKVDSALGKILKQSQDQSKETQVQPAGSGRGEITEEQRIQHQEAEDAKIRKLMGLE